MGGVLLPSGAGKDGGKDKGRTLRQGQVLEYRMNKYA